MTGINTGRFILAGITAGVVLNVLEGLASLLYAERLRTAMESHGLAVSESPAMLALYLLIGFVVGFVAVWIYVAARTRLGPGPGTAVKVGIVYWLGGYLIVVLSYASLGLFPAGMLTMWAVVGLVEMVLATLAGAWVYREA